MAMFEVSSASSRPEFAALKERTFKSAAGADRAISKEEFASAEGLQGAGSAEEVFATYDKNGDGSIARNEFNKLSKAIELRMKKGAEVAPPPAPPPEGGVVAEPGAEPVGELAPPPPESPLPELPGAQSEEEPVLGAAPPPLPPPPAEADLSSVPNAEEESSTPATPAADSNQDGTVSEAELQAYDLSHLVSKYTADVVESDSTAIDLAA